jgi:hypothetical protein
MTGAPLSAVAIFRTVPGDTEPPFMTVVIVPALILATRLGKLPLYHRQGPGVRGARPGAGCDGRSRHAASSAS